jgi:hypothetical protein
MYLEGEFSKYLPGRGDLDTVVDPPTTQNTMVAISVQTLSDATARYSVKSESNSRH